MNFLKGHKGGIAVFQCIIFTALLLLSGILIDGARIIVSGKEVQSAVNTAARSVLAGYDGELSGDYGLFALNTMTDSNTVNHEFIKYLKANLQTDTTGFGLVKYQVDESKTSVYGYRGLLDNEDNAFKEQILEYMKYRAPLNATRNVADKFISSGIFKKKDFAVKEKEAREKRKEAKINIDRLNNKIENTNTKVSEALSFELDGSNGWEYIEILHLLKAEYAEADGMLNAAVQGLHAYSAAQEEARSYAEAVNREEGLSADAEIKVYENEFDGAADSVNELKSKINEGRKIAEEHLESALPLLSEIESISAAIKSIESRDNEPADGQADRKSGEDGGEIAVLKSQLSEKIERINSLKSSLSAEKIQEIKVNERENTPEEAPGQEDNGKEKQLSELQNQLDKFIENRRMNPSWLISGMDFDNAALKDLKRFEEISLRDMPVSEESIDDAEEENNSIVAFMDKIKAAIESSAENVYVVEYIMDRFTYHASLTERNHYFQKGEVEYILWGGSSQTSNIAATMSSIGFLRFAVNSIDYFATSKVPHPVFRLLYALGRGMLQSAADCYGLYRGEDISICPSLEKSTLKLNYSDHLRVLLLLQAAADSRGQLNNMRQLIQVNIKNPDSNFQLQRPDFELMNYNTVLETRATVKIKLWFLPLLQLNRLKLPFIEGGSYVISREIHLGY